MSEELKPCPFCGGANLSIVPYGLERDDEQPADRPHAVSCEDCGSLGAEIAPHSAAVTAWNRRALCNRAEAEPAPAHDEREAFEAGFPPPVGVTFHAQLNRYCVGYSGTLMERDVYQAAWEGWQARATHPAQTEQQPEQSGLVSIPLEPTEAMLDAYWEQTGESTLMRGRVHDRAKRHYSAMVKAFLSTQGGSKP